MKSLRSMVLLVAVASVSFTAQQAFAQQEIDPDHFDQPVATKPVAKAPAHKATAQSHAQARTNIATKHAKQHHSQATTS
jgi:hypothetical protein